MPAPDLLRRFTPTPLATDLAVAGRAIRVETNSAVILEGARRTFNGNGAPKSGPPEFVWRLVSEAVPDCGPPWPEMTAFSDQRLCFVRIGQGGFLAVDLDSREAVGFLAEELTKDEPGFTHSFLAMLLSLTAPALGLTPEDAARFFPELANGHSLMETQL
jgi:hypothetical protein